MIKSPAFQFYPADYLASQRVQMMTLEEEGAYIRLLCYCWLHGSIPDDDAQIARLISKGASTTLATTVKAMFNQHTTDGKLIHDRLDHERSKQSEWSRKSSEGGKKSAELRKGGSRVVQPPYQPKGNITSTSTSSNISNKLDISVVLPFDSELFKQAWVDFSEHRKSKRAKMTKKAVALILKDLPKNEADAIASLEQSIKHGWTGVFPVKKESFATQKPSTHLEQDGYLADLKKRMEVSK